MGEKCDGPEKLGIKPFRQNFPLEMQGEDGQKKGGKGRRGRL